MRRRRGFRVQENANAELRAPFAVTFFPDP
jgi:hypothetical protein